MDKFAKAKFVQDPATNYQQKDFSLKMYLAVAPVIVAHFYAKADSHLQGFRNDLSGITGDHPPDDIEKRVAKEEETMMPFVRKAILDETAAVVAGFVEQLFPGTLNEKVAPKTQDAFEPRQTTVESQQSAAL